jgi:hypothetical protein
VQTLEDKCAGIVSLLELMLYHLDDAPGKVITQRQEWISERSSLDLPKPPPKLYNVACKGRCQDCMNALKVSGKKPDCPPDELWVRERDSLRRRYRMVDVEVSLMRLSEYAPTLAQAVWAQHVEPSPDPKTEPISKHTRDEREEWAWRGVNWMARDIHGDVIAYSTEAPTREKQAADLMAEGIKSPSAIARRLDCSVRHAKRLKAMALVHLTA